MPKNVSGLPFYLGCFAHSPDRVTRHEKAIGRRISCLQVSPSRGSWSSIMDSWWMSTPPGFQGILDVSVPLWQADGSLDVAANGGYNDRWTALGRMIHARFPGSTVRPGWEFNIPDWPWAAKPGNVDKWKRAFQHASRSLKLGGPSLLVEWNPNAGTGGSLRRAEDAWPGDDVVDIVALDSYDWDPPYTDASWAQHNTGYGGWSYWLDFARAKGKLFAAPEFGLANGNQNCGRDNPKFFQLVMPLLAKNLDIIYMISYFDEPMDYIRNSFGDGMLPKGCAEYARQLTAIAALGATGPTGPGKPGTTTPTTPTTPPTTPTGPLKVSAQDLGGGQVEVTWTPATTATVSRDGLDDDGDGPWTDTATGSYTFARLVEGQAYTFTVIAGDRTATAKLTIGGSTPTPTPTPEPDPKPTTPPAEEDTVTIRVPRSWVTDKAPRA